VPFVATVAAAIALASVAAFFGRYWWMLDLAANFRAHMAAVLVTAALVLALGRWYRTALVVSLAAALNAAAVLPLFIGPTSRPESTDLRVMSFNLLSDNTNYDEVIGFIAAEDPDVVVLHEASRPWEEALEAANLDYEITRGRTDDLIFGSLVLAKPGSEVQSFGFQVSDPRAIEVVLHSGVAVLGIHPLAPFPDDQTERRRFQFEFASLWAASRDGPRVIVGDFNASPWSDPFRRLRIDSGLRNSQAGFGLELSYPAQASPLLQVSIDHLLHSSDLAVADRRLGPPLGSDHFPLVVDLSLVDPRTQG
jgi:endonuclease/exonuclease/phosphatase (EEP) superfamily protein YafD